MEPLSRPGTPSLGPPRSGGPSKAGEYAAHKSPDLMVFDGRGRAVQGRRLTRPPSCVLFDLDGTLVDSAAGILESLASALRQLGLTSAGIPLAVATSKTEDQALSMIDLHDLGGYFRHMCGLAEAAGRWPLE